MNSKYLENSYFYVPLIAALAILALIFLILSEKKFQIFRPKSIDDFDYKKFSLVIFISTIVIFLIVVVFYKESSITGTIGDTIGGIFGPAVGLISAILVYVTFQKQVESNELVRNQFRHEIFDKYISQFKDAIQKLNNDKSYLDELFKYKDLLDQSLFFINTQTREIQINSDFYTRFKDYQDKLLDFFDIAQNYYLLDELIANIINQNNNFSNDLSPSYQRVYEISKDRNLHQLISDAYFFVRNHEYPYLNIEAVESGRYKRLRNIPVILINSERNGMFSVNMLNKLGNEFRPFTLIKCSTTIKEKEYSTEFRKTLFSQEETVELKNVTWDFDKIYTLNWHIKNTATNETFIYEQEFEIE
ncbi:MAG: hypothetical protein K1X55_10075 [Chitinophagales bacterium]|nr:hypothetical protein [Chitinophagales bacterium]